MKKILALLFSLFFLSSSSVFAQEDLSKINVNSLSPLSSNQIINTYSNASSWGYYSKDISGIDDYQYVIYTYASGDFDISTSFSKVSGKWKVYDNQICFKATKVPDGMFPEKMFTCASVYTDFNEGEHYLYMPGVGVYAKNTAVTPLID